MGPLRPPPPISSCLLRFHHLSIFACPRASPWTKRRERRDETPTPERERDRRAPPHTDDLRELERTTTDNERPPTPLSPASPSSPLRPTSSWPPRRGAAGTRCTPETPLLSFPFPLFFVRVASHKGACMGGAKKRQNKKHTSSFSQSPTPAHTHTHVPTTTNTPTHTYTHCAHHAARRGEKRRVGHPARFPSCAHPPPQKMNSPPILLLLCNLLNCQEWIVSCLDRSEARRRRCFFVAAAGQLSPLLRPSRRVPPPATRAARQQGRAAFA